MNRKDLKGAPLMLGTGTGRPRDPDAPKDLEAWCKHYGVELTGGQPAPAEEPPG